MWMMGVVFHMAISFYIFLFLLLSSLIVLLVASSVVVVCCWSLLLMKDCDILHFVPPILVKYKKIGDLMVI